MMRYIIEKKEKLEIEIEWKRMKLKGGRDNLKKGRLKYGPRKNLSPPRNKKIVTVIIIQHQCPRIKVE